MLEEKTYTRAEMAHILGTNSKSGMKNKLLTCGIHGHFDGRGDEMTITIPSIPDPFKFFCIYDLGVDPHTDFLKLRELYFYYFCDIEFRAMPDEVKEHRMKGWGHSLTRQSIRKYEKYLEDNNLVGDTFEYIYYFANEDHQRICDEEEYKEAWREYWNSMEENFHYSLGCILMMKDKYGGVAKKQAIPDTNALEAEKVNQLIELVVKDIEKYMPMFF